MLFDICYTVFVKYSYLLLFAFYEHFKLLKNYLSVCSMFWGRYIGSILSPIIKKNATIDSYGCKNSLWEILNKCTGLIFMKLLFHPPLFRQLTFWFLIMLNSISEGIKRLDLLQQRYILYFNDNEIAGRLVHQVHLEQKYV